MTGPRAGVPRARSPPDAAAAGAADAVGAGRVAPCQFTLDVREPPGGTHLAR
jgi:hypothetical protein